MIPIRGLKSLALCLICLSLVFSCAARSNQWGFPEYRYTYRIPEAIEDGWEVSSLQAEGLEPARIDALVTGILKRDFKNIHSILLVKNGKLVLNKTRWSLPGSGLTTAAASISFWVELSETVRGCMQTSLQKNTFLGRWVSLNIDGIDHQTAPSIPREG